MNYFNWQKIYKLALTSKANPHATTNQQPSFKPGLSIESIHQQALTALSISCLPQELEKLQELARQYDSGERQHDTFSYDGAS